MKSLFGLIGYEPEVATVSKMPPVEPDDPAYIAPKPKARRVKRELSSGETVQMSAIAADELDALKKDAKKWKSMAEDLLSMFRHSVIARNCESENDYSRSLSIYRSRTNQFLAHVIDGGEHKGFCKDAHAVLKEFYSSFLDSSTGDLNDDPTGEKHLAIVTSSPTPPDDLPGEPLPHPNWDRELGGEIYEQHFKRGSHFRKTYLHQCYMKDGQEKMRFLGEKK